MGDKFLLIVILSVLTSTIILGGSVDSKYSSYLSVESKNQVNAAFSGSWARNELVDLSVFILNAPERFLSSSPTRPLSLSPERLLSPYTERKLASSPLRPLSESPERLLSISPLRFLSESLERIRSSSPERILSPSPSRPVSAAPERALSPYQRPVSTSPVRT